MGVGWGGDKLDGAETVARNKLPAALSSDGPHRERHSGGQADRWGWPAAACALSITFTPGMTLGGGWCPGGAEGILVAILLAF